MINPDREQGSKVQKFPKHGASTADRTLLILDIISKSQTPLTAKELGLIANCSRNAAYRSVQSLLKAGYVTNDEKPGKFKMSLKAVRLNKNQFSRVPELSQIQTVLDEVSHETGESCNYEELQNDEVVILARSMGKAKNPFIFDIGQSTPAANTSIGRAILAYRHRRDAAKFLQIGLNSSTEKTIIDPFEYLAQLEFIKETGHSIDDEELILGLRCVAVPILTTDQNIYSGLAICGPTERFTISYLEELAKTLKDKSRKIAALKLKSFNY